MNSEPLSQRYTRVGGKLVRFKLAASGARILSAETFEQFHGNRKSAQLQEQLDRRMVKCSTE